MGNNNGRKQHSFRQRKQLLTVLVLSSILGMGLYAVPAWAETKTISGDEVKVETKTSGVQTTAINLDNGGIGSKTSASGNTLTISGGTIPASGPGSNIFGGVVASNLNSAATTVSNNSLTIAGNTAIGQEGGKVFLFGGFLSDYKATKEPTVETVGEPQVDNDKEQFTISGNTVTAAAVKNAGEVSVYGGAQGIPDDPQSIWIHRYYFDAGTASVVKNAVYLGTTAQKEADGTYSKEGITENTISTIKDNFYSKVYGGYATQGTAANNTIIARNIGLNDIMVGGMNYFGEANSNAVTFSGSYGYDAVIIGGFSEANYLCPNGDVKYNTVSITDSISHMVIGGSAYANANRQGGDFETAYLGFSAIENHVTIQGDSSIDGVFGGMSHGGAVSNTVDVISGSVANIWGGYSEGMFEWNGSSISAEKNSVTIGKKDGSTKPIIGSTVIGGQATFENAIQNQVQIYSASVGDEEASLPVTVSRSDSYSHWSEFRQITHTIAGGVATNISDGDDFDGGQAIDNHVSINDSTIGTEISNIYGGYSGLNASTNTVTLTNTTAALGTETPDYNWTKLEARGIFGGKSEEGNVSQNTVTLDNSSVYGDTSLYGGLSFEGNVSDNNVIVKNNSEVGVDSLYGGYSHFEGTVEKNSIQLEKSTLTENASLYGGYAGHDAVSNNKVSLSQMDKSQVAAIYGGYSHGYSKDDFYEAKNNEVNIEATELTNLEQLYGGYAYNGNVSGNKVNLKEATITGDNLELAVASGNNSYAKDNALSIDTSTITGLSQIYGSKNDETTSDNKFSITGSDLAFSNSNSSTLIGAYGRTVSNNTFSISDSRVSNMLMLVANNANENALDNSTTLTNAKISGLQMLVNAYANETSENNKLTISGGSLTYETETNGEPIPPEASLLIGGKGNIMAHNNQLEITGTSITDAQTIYAGESDNVALENQLTITTANISGASTIAGGKSSGLSQYTYEGLTVLRDPCAYWNKVDISGGSVTAENIYGGYVTKSTEESSADVSSHVFENEVTLGSGVTADNVIGAYTTMPGDTYGNTVTVEGGTIQKNLIGGKTPSGETTGNTLNISGGTIGTTEAVDDDGNPITNGNLIAAGYTDNGAADSNTVNVYAGTLGHMMSLYGGYSTTESTGNTLNLYTKDNTVENLGYFQTLNFYVPANAKAGDTMLEVTGTADVHGAAINAGVEDTTQLNPGEVINLIHDGNSEINTKDTSYAMMDGKDIVTDAAFLQRRAYIKPQDANTIVLYVPIDSQPILHPDTEVIADGQANAASTVANGSDAAVTDGLQAALTAWAESHEAARLREDDHAAMDMMGSPYISSPAGMSIRQSTSMVAASPLDAADAKNANVTLSAEEIAAREERDVEAKFTPYVMLGGHNLRYNSSSTVDTNGFNGELGFVRRIFKKDYADTIMPFVEYGTGNYTIYKNGTRGDGSQRYVGAGILLRRDQENGVHYEGLVRAGRLNGDYAGRIAGYRTTYNSGAGYIAAHAGLGKIYRQDSNDYNLYGKFFYSHLGGDSVTLHSSLGSADYELDSVNSYWTRLGFRWTKHLDEDTTTFYAGLGWDYEFDGKATARYRDYTTPDASMKGSSEFLELGWQSKVTKENPWGGRCESHRVERRETGLYIWGNHHAPHVAVLADRQKEAFILV